MRISLIHWVSPLSQKLLHRGLGFRHNCPKNIYNLVNAYKKVMRKINTIAQHSLYWNKTLDTVCNLSGCDSTLPVLFTPMLVYSLMQKEKLFNTITVYIVTFVLLT